MGVPDLRALRTSICCEAVRADFLAAASFASQALGCTLPPPLTTTARTKKDGVAYLEVRTLAASSRGLSLTSLSSPPSRRQSQQRLIASASCILIAGGGALGIQYASDIADLYNNPANASLLPTPPPPKKRITLVHSRDRFLPLYKQDVHDEVLRRLEELGVEVVLGERVQLPDPREDEPGATKTLRLTDGREIEYDLLVRALWRHYVVRPLTLHCGGAQLRCTGQKPNSHLFRDFLPEALDEWGYINVRPTLQVDVSNVADAGRLSDKVKRNVYAIGDVRSSSSLYLSLSRVRLTYDARAGGQRRRDQGRPHGLEPSRLCDAEYHVLHRDGRAQRRLAGQGRARE